MACFLSKSHTLFCVLFFGLTDYEMGIEPFEYFVAEYATYGCEVVQQKLNLTNEDKQRIISALQRNAEPNNKVYRYNYFL